MESIFRDKKDVNDSQLVWGQIALPFVLIIGGIIVEITIASTVVAYFLASSGLSERLSERAGLAAKAGINDAVLRIVNDKEYGALSQSYSFGVDRDSVMVSVTRVFNAQTNVYAYTVSATGLAGARASRIIATLSVDEKTGKTRLESLIEAPAS